MMEAYDLLMILECILFGIIETALAVYLFSSYSKRTVPKGLVLVFGFISSAVISYFAVIFSGIPSNLFFIRMIILYALSVCYTLKWKPALYLTLTVTAVSFLTDILTGFEDLIFENTFNIEIGNVFYLFVKFILHSLLLVFAVFLIARRKPKSFENIGLLRLIGLCMLPISTVVITVLLLDGDCFMNASDEWTDIFYFVALVLLFLSNIWIFYIVDTSAELAVAKEQIRTGNILLRSQKQYYDDIFKSQQEVRRIRHDLKNIFIALSSALKNGENEKAIEIIENRLSQTNDHIELEIGESDILSAVIHSKCKAAEKSGIKINVKKSLTCTVRPDELDLAVLIGNVLDNAIEAANKVSENRAVDFSFVTENDSLILMCKNPTHTDIDTKILKTTKSDSQNHGFGLISIGSVVKKYGGEYFCECENRVFTFTAVMMNR